MCEERTFYEYIINIYFMLDFRTALIYTYNTVKTAKKGNVKIQLAEKTMDNREKAALAVGLLKKEYPDAVCSLNEKEPFRLLVAVRLSAQCTDKRVNEVTPALFERFPTIEAMADADITEIEGYIRSCGFYHGKARDIAECARALLSEYGGVIPNDIDTLTRLPGVGRKTANLLVGDLYGGHAVVCDTHFIRIMRRLGFTDTSDPLRTEKIMRPLLPETESADFCHRCVLHGRAVCRARGKRCGECVLKTICNEFNNPTEENSVKPRQKQKNRKED